MAVTCDTRAIYALYDADDAHHVPVREAWASESGPFVLPMTLLSEVDYLLHARLGIDAAPDFVESVESGAFVLEPLLADDVTRCRELMIAYRDLALGLADASIVAIAERLNLHRVLTVDFRHFRTVRPKHVSYLLLVPADSRA